MKNLKIIMLSCLALVFITSCEKTEVESQEFNTNEELLENSKNHAKITMKDGTQISFYKVNDGDLQGVFLMEETDCGECSPLNAISNLVEKELSEQEIFWALSEPGTAIPEFLEIPKQKASNIQAQGWGRNAIKNLSPAVYQAATVACNNNSFTSSIAYGFIGTPEFIRLDKTPDNYNSFINDCADLGVWGCEKGPRYRYTATFSNIKRWKGKICSKAVQNSSNNHYMKYFCDSSVPCETYVGPELYFEYKSNGVWKTMKNTFGGAPAGFEVPANSTKVYTYSWRTSSNTSFRLRVKYAMGKDQFDFMMDKQSAGES